MHRTLALISAAFLASQAALAETKSYDTGAFTAISVKGGLEVTFEPGPAHKVLVEQAEGDFSDILVSTAKNGQITVGRKSLNKRSMFHWPSVNINEQDGQRVVKVNGKIMPRYVVRITAPDVTSIVSAQSASVQAVKLKASALSLSASSSGELAASGESGSAELSASSAGELDASKLNARGLNVNASSSGSVKGASLGESEVSISVSSAGDAEVSVSNALIVTANASSGGEAEIKGVCGVLSAKASSGASVRASGLSCRSGNLSASSGGDVDAAISQDLNATASSGGSVEVTGNPGTKNVTESSGGDVSIKNVM